MLLPMLSHRLLSVLLLPACLHANNYLVTPSFSASSNPAYEGSNVTLTCSLSGGISTQRGNSVSSNHYFIQITNLNSSASAICDTTNDTWKTSILFETVTISCDSQSLRLSFLAYATSALNFKCESTLNSVSSQGNIMVLKVYKAPAPPDIQPSYLTFNNSYPVLISCTSPSGNPPAEIELKITRNSKVIMNYTATYPTPVLLRLNATMELHDAIATCQVKNHLLPNMTVASFIKVNHIFLRTGASTSQNALESAVLNCSDLVDSYPPPVFAWSNISASSLTTLASSGSFGPVGYSGNLSCTATNNVLNNSVVVTFYINKGSTTRSSVTSSSPASMQTNASSAATTTLTSITQSSSRAPAKISDGATSVTVIPRPSSTQGSSLSTSVTGSVFNNTGSPLNNEPIIIGVAVSVSLFSAAVAVTIIILRYCRMRTPPPRNLPASQSASKIIGGNELSESQGDDAEDIVYMTDNGLYGSNPPPLCAANKSSIIYDEPYQRPSVCSTLLYTSQDKDSHGLSILLQVCDVIAQHYMDDRSAASSQSEVLEVHHESSAAMSEGPYSTQLEVSATPIGTAASVRATEPPCDQPVSQQCFTNGKPSHNKSFENMTYMDIQLAESNAPKDYSPQEE